MAAPEVEDLRRMIDQIDEEIIRLLHERLRVCRMIGEAKRSTGAPLRDPAREAEVLRRAGVLDSVFREIIRLCVRVQGGG